MIRLIALATIATLASALPAAADCFTVPAGGDKAYPRGGEALLVCQQQELAATVDALAAAEQLRALQRQMEGLQLEQMRLQQQFARPFPDLRF